MTVPTPTSAPPLGRVLTAMVTPFDDQGAVDYDAAARLATYLVDHGHDGVLVSGTTGESPTTSNEEKTQLLRAVIEAVGDRVPVMAGVGTNETAHTIHLAEEAEKAGAQSLLVVTPYYNKPPQASLIAHFTAVADATGLPNVLYDIPGRSGVPIETDTLKRLAEHERIVGVKDAKADFQAGAEVIATTGLSYYSGDDGLDLPWLSVGAVGKIGVASHALGEQYAALWEAGLAGDLTKAQQINARLLPAVNVVMHRSSQGAIRAKAAMQLLGVIDSRATRLPLLPASDDEVEELRKVLGAAGADV
ncbi:4-hydroxy-tetrahydrodipicolinate synthase [Epidermidibacterium keratini]|uniref:4-hydroxy-tetrahydrodipicolinate synthase n=1 Tax=Epidermidibacterium keratini TaxID=1891644 RepID=A0A7L4YRR5_9ACTN|nr:4-hydroxy-tetrahydrodipicolinate synthase [Epidermidibacterium keratini]QHC01905.1 4-hydroxy-tetrahydrodipicolinate synthase [Epidermidibacterium keratini]